MAASAGTLIAQGASGRQYVVDLYIPDAVAGLVGFNPAGTAGATALTYWRAPENVVITDVAVVAGMTATGAVCNSSGAIINGGVLRYTTQLNTLATRPKLAIQVRGGELFGMTNI